MLNQVQHDGVMDWHVERNFYNLYKMQLTIYIDSIPIFLMTVQNSPIIQNKFFRLLFWRIYLRLRNFCYFIFAHLLFKL